jgi:hypothetical protein
MNIIRLGIPWLSLLFGLLYFCSALAAEMTVAPSVISRGEYDDNVFFSRVFEESDYLLVLTPGVSVDYRTERGHLNGSAAVDVLRYAQNENRNRTNQRYSATGGLALSELFQARANLSYVNDTTLDSQLEETGIVTLRQQRETYSTGAGLTYRLSELSDIGIDSSYRRLEYDGPSLDYDDYKVAIPYNLLLADGKSVFTVQPYYDHYRSDASQVDNYGLGFGLAHSFSEALILRTFLGVRYTKVEYRFIVKDLVFDPSLLPFFPFRTVVGEVEERDSNWNGVGDISITKRGERRSFTVGYKQDLGYSSTGDPLQLYRLYGSFSQSVTARLNFGLSASAYRSKSEGRISQTDSRYFSFSSSLKYNVTERHYLQMGYRYSVTWDDRLETEDRADRNIVWIGLGLIFPKKF